MWIRYTEIVNNVFVNFELNKYCKKGLFTVEPTVERMRRDVFYDHIDNPKTSPPKIISYTNLLIIYYLAYHGSARSDDIAKFLYDMYDDVTSDDLKIIRNKVSRFLTGLPSQKRIGLVDRWIVTSQKLETQKSKHYSTYSLSLWGIFLSMLFFVPIDFWNTYRKKRMSIMMSKSFDFSFEKNLNCDFLEHVVTNYSSHLPLIFSSENWDYLKSSSHFSVYSLLNLCVPNSNIVDKYYFPSFKFDVVSDDGCLLDVLRNDIYSSFFKSSFQGISNNVTFDLLNSISSELPKLIRQFIEILYENEYLFLTDRLRYNRLMKYVLYDKDKDTLWTNKKYLETLSSLTHSRDFIDRVVDRVDFYPHRFGFYDVSSKYSLFSDNYYNFDVRLLNDVAPDIVKLFDSDYREHFDIIQHYADVSESDE